MGRLAKSVSNGSVSKQAFVNVLASYVSDREKELKSERPNLERIKDLDLSIKFCENCLNGIKFTK